MKKLTKNQKMSLTVLNVKSFATALISAQEQQNLVGQSPVPTIAESNIVC